MDDLLKRLRDYEEYEQSRDGQIICAKSDMAQEAAARIEQLEAENRELALQVLASGGQAQEAYEAQLKAEAATAARIAELESSNGVHIFRALSKQEMVEVEKMAADGNFQEAAQKFGGQVTYHQDQRDLPPMTNAELALHLRGRLVPMSVAYRAASRIEQLVATVELLGAALTRANAAAAAAYEVAAREVECGCGAGPCQDTTNCSAEDASAIRALATPDQTAALDTLIAEAEARVWDKAADIARQAVEITGHRMREAKEKKNKKEERDWQSMLFCAVDIRTAILAASKKGGV